MGLAVRDPRSGRVRPLGPRPGRPFTIYVCGPTVYADAHVGHARTYLFFDVLKRHLQAEGVRVRHVMNITDFEDKIFDRALALETSWKLLARREERRFRSDLGSVGILPADLYPRASDHIAAMRSTVRALARTGRLEPREQGLVYRPSDRRSRESPLASEAVEHAVAEPGVPSPDGLELGEFSVWLPPHPGGPAWPSPWGMGTPGWHLECYVMARRYLGLPVDLHGGGLDLAFPHHYAESELAQALDRRPFARHYLYADFVTQHGVKMSKSTGNLVTVRSAVQGAGAAAVRWYLLSVPYGRPLEWDQRALEVAAHAASSVRRAFRIALGDVGGGSLAERSLRRLRDDVSKDLSRNLGTERALARIARYATVIERSARGAFPKGSRRSSLALVADMERRLGLPLH
ncbi:MAG: class I tRNA ligase family protein [Thermoplasmata archaeon]|nr:class I tRNA ligase family protein [Thermoplasmata archaeon]MCI4359094.1 class I tRNA ligase family protein [Thermoplasmata archaeon]